MCLEIERKFLVTSQSFKKGYFKKTYIKQGFLNSDKKRVVRVRIHDDKAYLTIKGMSDPSGTTRFEWEKEITPDEAEKLMPLSEHAIIEKYRYLVKVGKHTFEIDEFLGQNEGLLIAEIELKDEKEHFSQPLWLGEEVTGIARYYNAELSKNPYTNWAKIKPQ